MIREVEVWDIHRDIYYERGFSRYTLERERPGCDWYVSINMDGEENWYLPKNWVIMDTIRG